MAVRPEGDGGDRRGHGPAILDVLRTLWKEVPSDHVLTVSAGLAYYAVFGLLPALAAAAALWGQVGGFATLSRAAESGRGLLPPETVQVLEQLGSVEDMPGNHSQAR